MLYESILHQYDIKEDRRLTWGEKAHNFELEKALECVPPKDVLKFGNVLIDKDYRDALFEEYPFYNCGNYSLHPMFRKSSSIFTE